MTDIVERLKERAGAARCEGNMTARCDADHFVEAADAIEELATTHQRTLEALREAEKAIRNAYGAITSGQTEDKDAAGTLRAALARIKETT